MRRGHVLVAANGQPGEAIAIPNLAARAGDYLPARARRRRRGRRRASYRLVVRLAPFDAGRRDRAERRRRARDRAGAGRRGGRLPRLAPRSGLVPPADGRARRGERALGRSRSAARGRGDAAALRRRRPQADGGARAKRRAGRPAQRSHRRRPIRSSSWWCAPTSASAPTRATTCARAPSSPRPARRRSPTTIRRTRRRSATGRCSATSRAATSTSFATAPTGWRCSIWRSTPPERGGVEVEVTREDNTLLARAASGRHAPARIAGQPIPGGPILIRVVPRHGPIDSDDPYRLTVTSRPAPAPGDPPPRTWNDGMTAMMRLAALGLVVALGLAGLRAPSRGARRDRGRRSARRSRAAICGPPTS